MNKLVERLSSEAAQYARDYVAECKHYGYWMEPNEYDIQYRDKLLELFVTECVKVCRGIGEYAMEQESAPLTSNGTVLFSGMWAGAEKCVAGITALLHDEGFKK